MALQTKTISSSTTSNGYTLRLELTENSTSVASNTSSVSWRLYLTSGSWNFSQYKVGWSVSLSGTVVSSRSKASASQVSIAKNGSLTVASGTSNVTHGTDGSLNMAVAASIDMDSVSYTPGPMSLSGSMALTNIPRASTLTAANGTLGTAQTLTVNRASSSFTHTLTYACGSASGTILSNSSAASTSWTPPLSLAAQNTTGQSVSVTFTLTTKNGGATVGTTTKTVSMAIPASVKPTASATVAVVNDNATVNSWGVAVKGYSKYKVTTTFSNTNSQGSTLKSRSVKINATGQTLTASPATSSVLTSTTRTVVVKVVDSRDRPSDEVTVTGPVIYDYGNPTVSEATACRCDSGGTADDAGTYLSVKCTGEVYTCGGHNARTVQFRYRVTGGSWSGWTSLTSGTACTVNAGLDYTRSYEVQFRVTDTLGAARSVTVTIPTAAVTMNLRSGGSGVAFGGYAQRDETVDFTTWDVVGKVKGLAYAVPIPSGADVDSYITPGEYGIASNNAAASVTHLPIQHAGRLMVFTSTGHSEYGASEAWKYITQEYTTIWDVVYRRRGESGSGTAVVWSDWTLLCGVDAVVETGTSGNWSYKKFADGQAVLWGIHSVTPSSSTAIGSMYYSGTIYLSTPFGLANASITGTADNLHMVANADGSYADSRVSFRLLRPTAISTTTAIPVKLQVWGRWK